MGCFKVSVPNVSLWSPNCRHFSTLSLSLCILSVFFQSVRLSSEPAHLHPRRCSSPSDHLAGTQLCNCVSRQMLCRTVGDGGGGVMQSPSILLTLSSPFTRPPHGPHPQHPSLHTFSSPLFSPSVIPGLSISARGTVGKLCVSALPNNYLQLRLTAVWPSERLSH